MVIKSRSKKKTVSKSYRPNIHDIDRNLRDQVESIQSEFPHLNKHGLEKMIFEAGIKPVLHNLRAANKG